MVSPSKSCSYGSWKLPTVANRTIPRMALQPERQAGAEEDPFGK